MVYYRYRSKLINLKEDNPVLNVTQEVKKSVEGFEDLYEVSSEGYVSNYRKQLKHYVINSGYVCIKLSKDSIAYSFLVHRLVAKAHVPNPDNKPCVNHLDGDKLNNKASNLEWCTRKENARHAIDIGLVVYNKPTLGKRIGKSSEYHNVFKSGRRWGGTIRVNKKNRHQKTFETEIEAAAHVNWIIDELGLVDRAKNDV